MAASVITIMVNLFTINLHEKEIKDFLLDVKKYEHLSVLFIWILDFHDLLINCSNSFNIICISEMWFSNIHVYNNSNYDLPGYDSIYLENETCKKGGGVLIYIQKHSQYKLHTNLFQMPIRNGIWLKYYGQKQKMFYHSVIDQLVEI